MLTHLMHTSKKTTATAIYTGAGGDDGVMLSSCQAGVLPAHMYTFPSVPTIMVPMIGAAGVFCVTPGPTHIQADAALVAPARPDVTN